MNKRIKSMILVYAIIFVVECVLFFAIPFPKDGAALTEFIFTLIAVCGGCGISWYSFKNQGLKSKIYGFSMFKIGYVYMTAQLIVGWIIAIVGCFVRVPVWIPLVVSVLILGASGIGVIGTDNARDIITEQQEQIRVSVRNMKTFRMDIGYIVDSCTDKDLKKPLEKLADQFRYSDPVSSEELSDIENNLQQEVKNLAALVSTNTSLAKKKADEVSVLLADRNRRCKELKQ